MPPRSRQAPLARQGREQDRQRQIAELRDRADAQIRSLITGEDWAVWLRLAARLPGMGFTNILLIAAQRSSVTFVAGYQEWQAQGRHVRSGEPGIQVFAQPRTSSGKPRSSPAAGAEAQGGTANRGREGRLTYVWDIAQTEGAAHADDPVQLPSAGGTPPGLWDALTWLARREGFAVEREACDPRPGLTNWSNRRIRIRPGLDAPEAGRVLIHELGHILVHGRSPHQQGDSTAGCRGIQKIEADSVAFIVATRLGMDTSCYSWPYVASWAGRDQRARPQETIRATGSRIATAAAAIAAHLDTTLFGTPAQPAVRIPDATRVNAAPASAPDPDSSEPEISRILLDAERFYCDHLSHSWVPGYLAARCFGPATVEQWRIGYASAGWTALTSHLRRLGHDDAVIEASGLARRSSRGTLIDHFRDRVMLGIRNEHGVLAGFTGRARPGAGPTVPKYLNSPETSVYIKGDLLFGLHEARGQLAGGAVPVIAEGPFDAIAISAADPRQFAGLAPCGTALTSRQAAALGRVADVSRVGVLVALDGDRAGREGAIKAYTVLLAVTSKTTALMLPADRDPAEILQAEGPATLRDVLQNRTEPLAAVVIDAHLDSWGSQLDHPEGQLRAMRSAARLIASLLPSDTASRILQITGGHHLATLDADLRPIANPELSAVARTLPASAACQIVRVADRLESDYSEVTTEVANAISKEASIPKCAAARGHQNDPGRRPTIRAETDPARLALVGFPDTSHTVANSTPGLEPRPSIPSALREIASRRPAHR
jgi:DNA primase